MKKVLFAFAIFISLLASSLSVLSQFTHQDTLRGSNGPGRSWWDVMSYNISVDPDYNEKVIRGWVDIEFGVIEGGKNKTFQIDLQEPLAIEKISLDKKNIQFNREGNVYWLDVKNTDFKKSSLKKMSSTKGETTHILKIFYSGKPIIAKRPPWDGGWIFAKDEKGRPWMTVACQGLGASAWYPCKDYQGDEPNNGAILQIIAADTLKAIGNGNLMFQKNNTMGRTLSAWRTKSPINNYNIIPYIGKYTNWKENFYGERGNLDCSYWVIDYNLEKAKEQFKQAPMVLKAFEYWFGPYPFYPDGFKLIESPHLGMEHQSAVAYGNGFKNGYRGKDLSQTGWGLKWDFIIVHEVGHEWFGNNITARDIADMWIHEGFTNYSETLFTQYYYGKEAGDDYCIGTRKLIRNDEPIIGTYGVNKEGSGDMYYKGGNMLHTIRHVINDDEKFRSILRALNTDFYHKTVTSEEIENYMSEKSGIDLSKIFDQYLRTVKIPVLEYKFTSDNMSYRWTNCVENFDMPVMLAGSSNQWLKPGTEWQSVSATKDILNNGLQVNRNFYITVKKVE